MNWDLDINTSAFVQLKDIAQQLRDAIRKHRDAKGHDLCWLNNLELYAALPETKAPDPQVPPWPEFMAGCVAYRASLDIQNSQIPTCDEWLDPSPECDKNYKYEYQAGWLVVRYCEPCWRAYLKKHCPDGNIPVNTKVILL